MGVLTVFFWLIAKVVGLIHTPWYIEAIPYIGGLVTIGAIVKVFGKYAQKIDSLVYEVKEVNIEIKGVDKRLYSVENKLSLVDQRLGLVEAKIS